MANSNDYIVKPVYKALQVLQCLGKENRKLALTEICQRVRLPKTTVFRYLYTLRECGFVAYDADTDQYWLGLRVLELGKLASEQLHIREIALPLMRDLRDRFNETVNLGVLDGGEVVYVELVESRHSLRMQPGLGIRDPVYSTALGKAILAFLPQDQWPAYLPEQLYAVTEKTHTSYETLQQDLIATQKRGFSIDNEENVVGGYCVGAPIFNHLNQIVAALSISAPTSRLTDVLQQEIVTAATETATAISSQLGYQPDQGIA